MKIGEIYELAVRKGMEHDPRGLEAVEKTLAREKERFKDLKDDEREEYDDEKLKNPYADSRLLYGDPEKEVRRVLAGVDMEVGEMLLADRLAERGRPIDLVISHHPEGKALAALHEVMHLQEDTMARLGVPINIAEGIMAARIGEVKRTIMPINHNRAVDVARILDIPLMCLHTTCDNLVNHFLQRLMEERRPETLQDLVKLLKEVPEYKQAVGLNAGPVVVVGSAERRAGKIVVDMTGGTGGSEDAYGKLAAAGVGTLVVMHISEKHRKEAEKNHVNVVVAGHMASDSLGLNLFLDELVRRGVEIEPCAGLLRVDRTAE
ncbi:MAG: NGG1p interacting factor NIF3 [Candidatus Desulforudis sp.]|nr:NGG1p interacting factor NIF3 [Desulforudis sp.]